MQKKYFLTNLFFMVFLLVGMICIKSIDSKLLNPESEKFLNIPSNTKVVNVGSSHGKYGFNYTSKSEGVNLALDSQPIYYDYQIYKKIKSKLAHKAIIVIPISIFTLYQGNNFSDINEKRYYNFLEYQQIYNVKYKEFILYKYFFDFKEAIVIAKRLINKILNKKIRFTYPEDLSLEMKTEEATKTATRHLGLSKENINENPEISKEYLKNFIKEIKKDGNIPLLVTTPQTYLYNAVANKKEYDKRIYQHLKEINDVTYFDYFHDFRFENHLEYFFDDDHLNEKGAIYFTQVFLEDIKNKIK